MTQSINIENSTTYNIVLVFLRGGIIRLIQRNQIVSCDDRNADVWLKWLLEANMQPHFVLSFKCEIHASDKRWISRVYIFWLRHPIPFQKISVIPPSVCVTQIWTLSYADLHACYWAVRPIYKLTPFQQIYLRQKQEASRPVFPARTQTLKQLSFISSVLTCMKVSIV